MSKTPLDKLTATTVVYKDGKFTVRYHDTDVVVASPKTHEVTLDCGGYRSATTKARMNRAAVEFGLDYSVYQKDKVWYVDTNLNTLPWDDVNCETLLFDERTITFTV